MKRLLIITALLAWAVSAYAAQNLQNAVGTPVQGFAPEGSLTQALTAPSTTVDLSESVAFGVYCASDSKLRMMPASNSSKTTYKQFTIVGGNRAVFVRNQATPFANISGCVGDLTRQ